MQHQQLTTNVSFVILDNYECHCSVTSMSVTADQETTLRFPLRIPYGSFIFSVTLGNSVSEHRLRENLWNKQDKTYVSN